MLKKRSTVVEAEPMAPTKKLKKREKKAQAEAKINEKALPKGVTEESLLQEWLTLKEKAKSIEARLNDLKPQIAYQAHHFGVRNGNGSFIRVIGDKSMQLQARVKMSIRNDVALDILSEKGLSGRLERILDVDAATTYLQRQGKFEAYSIPVITEALLEQLLLDGEISAKDIERMAAREVSYAVGVYNYDPEAELHEDKGRKTTVKKEVEAPTTSKLKRKGK